MDDLAIFKPGQLDRETIEGTPVQRPKNLPRARLRPDLAVMFDDAYETLAAELEKLKDLARSEKGLNLTETSKLGRLVDSLTKLAKEERAQTEGAGNGLEDLTDEELFEQVKRKVLMEEAVRSGLVRKGG